LERINPVEFGDGTDGSLPYAGLSMDTSSNLYGTTSSGGTLNEGTVFEISTIGSPTPTPTPTATPTLTPTPTATPTPSGAEILIKPENIDCPNTAIGSTSTAEVRVTNTGTGLLIGTVNTPSAPFGLRGSGSFNLSRKTEATITLTFSPTSTTHLGRSATVQSNAVNHSTVQLTLQGSGKP